MKTDAKFSEQLDGNDPQVSMMINQNPQKVLKSTMKHGTTFRRLIEACKRKELHNVRLILSDRPELANQRDKQQRSLLHYAVIMMVNNDDEDSNRRQEVATGQLKRSQLISNQAEVDRCIECFDYLTDRCDIKLWWSQDIDGLSVLHMAVISSNVPMVEHIIYEHPYALKYPLVCSLDREHHSPLHWAVITNNLDSVKLLVNYGGTKLAHEPDLNGATPLHYATQTSDYPRYRQQLSFMLKSVGAQEKVAETGSRQQDAELTLNEASGINKAQADSNRKQHQLRSLEILEYLVRLPKINLECFDKDQRTPLLWAASSGNREAIELLLANGANLASCDMNRLGALHCAASHGFTDCLESILSFRNSTQQSATSKQQVVQVDANQVDNLNCTPLFYSVLSGNVDCVEALLERGALSDWQDSKGRTAAHFAALKGQLGALKLLQERGANLWLANKQGDLPLHYAIKSGRLQVVRWLLDHSPYERAVNAINNFGRAPIHLAVMRNNVQLVDYLIRCGANLNQLVKTRSKTGSSGKQSVVESAQTSGVKDNSSSKGSNKLTNYHYETALDIAKNLNSGQDLDCLRLLEQNQAKSANQVLSERNQLANRSIFELQSVEGPSPIGFETSCSSASPHTLVNNQTAQAQLPELNQTSSNMQHPEQVPRLPGRPAPDPLPYTDSTGSSALSQNSLTSVRGVNQSFLPATSTAALDEQITDHSLSQADNEQQQQQHREKFKTSCDNCAKQQNKSSPPLMSTKPYSGGISYNNDHICASIKCKLYNNNNSEQFCNRHPPGSAATGNRASKCNVKQQRQQSAPVQPPNYSWPNGGGQEIVTNVNVYTSPCAHCMQHQQQPAYQAATGSGTGSGRCLDCFSSERARDEPQRQQQQFTEQSSFSKQQVSKRDVACSADETTVSEGEESDINQSDDDEEVHLPNLMAPSIPGSTATSGAHSIGGGRLRHLPPSQGHEQHLPVILSDREQSTSATSNEQQEDEDEDEHFVGGEKPEVGFTNNDDELIAYKGEGRQQKSSPVKRPLMSPAFEEPRFDRSMHSSSSGSRVPRATDRYMNSHHQIRSPVADYIHSPTRGSVVQPHRSPENVAARKRNYSEASSLNIQQAGRGRRSTSSQRTPDFSQVKPKVDSNRFPAHLDPSSYKSDPSQRSQSMSVLSQDTARHSLLNNGKSPQPYNGNNTRSVSRQTIIKTRRLSVDSVELATRVEKAIRKYKQETKLFEELQNLKRSQIRSGRANEALLVKRLVEHLRHDTRDLIGLDTYQGPYTYKSYERFLYDQLRKLSQSNCAKLSRHQPPYNRLVADGEGESRYQADDYDEDDDVDYLDEDLKAELELRRIIGDNEELKQQQQHENCEDDLESFVLEPSGALEDIRVKGDGLRDEEKLELIKRKSIQDPPQKESMQIVHSMSSHDDEDGQEKSSGKDADDDEGIENKQIVRREASVSSTPASETGSGDFTSGREVAATSGEQQGKVIEDEAKSMSSAIITDALGNISRVGSMNDLNKLSAQPEVLAPADAETSCSVIRDEETKPEVEFLNSERSLNRETDPNILDQESKDHDGDQMKQPSTSGGRRRSIVNIGNKMELIYHDVGIEIDPAPDMPKVEEEIPGSAETKGDEISSDRLTDVVEEDEPQQQKQVAQGERSVELEQEMSAESAPTSGLEDKSSRGDESRQSDCSSAKTTIPNSSDNLSRDESTETDAISNQEQQQQQVFTNSKESSRRASSPSFGGSGSSCGSSFKRSSRRDPRHWSGGSSFSDTTPATLLDTTQKVFNGYDLDKLHRERSRSRGALKAKQVSQDDQVDQIKEHPSAGNDEQVSGEASFHSEKDGRETRVKGSRKIDDLSGEKSEQDQPEVSQQKAKKPINTKRKLVRSKIPEAKYILNVPLEEIKERWSQIKLEERLKLSRNEGDHYNNDIQLMGSEKVRSGKEAKVGLYGTKSQPNLKQNYELNDCSNQESNYTLLYEINEFMKNLGGGDNEEEAEEELGKGSMERNKKVVGGNKWHCQRMAAQIVDVRTVKRTLSLPETVMYSNNLLKRFNILKL